jgi:predicted DCC family thiol-disulfide oxidoreductase YuxK
MEITAQGHGKRCINTAMLDRRPSIYPVDKASMKIDPVSASSITSPSIVFYDGTCGICQSFASWLMGLDQARGLSLVAYQQIDPSELPAPLTPEMTQQAMHLLDSQGNLYRGARAVFEAMRSLPGLWGCMGTVFSNRLMSSIAEPFYRLVANRRTVISRLLGLRVCEPAPTTLQRPDTWDHE